MKKMYADVSDEPGSEGTGSLQAKKMYYSLMHIVKYIAIAVLYAASPMGVFAQVANSGSACFTSSTTPPDSRVSARMTWTINADNTVTIRTVLSNTFVDNTYGTGAVGWPSGHKFSELTGSDHLQLALYDANNVKRMEFKMDYLTASSAAPSGYKSLGVTGGEGNMLLGNAPDVVSVVTSLDRNFNTYNYILTTNSPVTDPNYTPNTSYPNWIYDVWYEVTVRLSAFGAAGFGQGLISGVHASPSKTGSNSEPVTKTTCPELSASISAISETCLSARNGSIDLTVLYGEQPYSYLWSNGATTQDLSNLAPGSYSVTVTDAVGSKATASAVIMQSSLPCSGILCFSSAAVPPNPNVEARIFWTVNADNTVTIRTVLAKTFVDNTYGTGSVGWPSAHKFGDLVGSDQLQLAVYDATGQKRGEFKMDYITASSTAPSGYKSLGVSGGDGNMIFGNESDIVDVVTSLDRNFNTYNYVLTTNSPATNINYTPNASYPNWIYDVWYEVKLKMSMFGPSGFGSASITGVHASPSKTGKNTEPVTPTDCPVPVPPTAIVTPPTCVMPTGKITVTSPLGSLYEYSKDGTNWQSSPVFGGLPANTTYTISVRNTTEPGFVSIAQFVIGPVPSAPAPPQATVIHPTCTVSTGTITVISPTGPGFEYSRNGTVWQTSTVFSSLAANTTYTIYARNASTDPGCVSSATYTINPAPNPPVPPSATLIQPTCAVPTGTITITNPVGPTYEYSKDGMTVQSSPVFSGLAPNVTYNIYVRNTASPTCISSSQFVINPVPNAPATPQATIVQPTCAIPTGNITVTSPTGSNYEYSKNGANWQTSTVFGNLTANASYTIFVRNTAIDPGCISSASFMINQVPSTPETPLATVTQPTCTVSTGTITVTAPTGASYEYSLNGTTWQSSPVFGGLPGNMTYLIYVRNTAADPGCVSSAPYIVNLAPPAPATPLANVLQPTCAVPTGTITVTSPTGLTYEYSRNGTTWQSSPVFSGLAGNATYTTYVRNTAIDPGCISNAQFAIGKVPDAPAIPLANIIQPTCSVPTGTIMVTSPTGATYEYSTNGTIWQMSPVFTGLPANATYTIRVRNLAVDPGCISSSPFVIKPVPAAPAVPVATLIQPTCAVPTGTITVTSPVGESYEYSKDALTWQSSTVFSGLAANMTYTVYVRNTATDRNCLSSSTFAIGDEPVVPAVPQAIIGQPTCTVSTGTITVTAPVGQTYQYSRNGSTWQSSPVFSNLAGNTTYIIYVRNTATDPGCVSAGSFVIYPSPVPPAIPQAILVQPTCAVPTGKITVISPTGPTFEYSRNGTTWQSSTVFSGLAGNATYKIYVRNTATDPDCISSAQFIICAVPNAPDTPVATITQPTCAVQTGTIIVTSPVGPGYEYSKDGLTVQTSPVFSGLAANKTYTIWVRNVLADPQCISSAQFVIGAIPDAPAIPLATLTQPTCSVPTGTITVTAPTGSTYQYSINGTMWQISPVFSNLAGNATYTVFVRNSATDPGCLSSAQFVIKQSPDTPPAPLATLIQPTCVVPTGTITITSPVGPGYQYSKDGVTIQTSPVFSGLEANKTYTIYLRNTAYPDCIVSGRFTIGPIPNAPATPVATLVQPTCAVPTGTITVTSPIGAGYEYSRNGTTWQTSTQFSGLPGNATYTISVRNTNSAPGCVSSAQYVINSVPDAPVTPLATVIQPTCAVPTGKITVISPVGAMYEYSKNGTTWQTSPIFSGLPGNATYTISVRNTTTDPACISAATFIMNMVPNAPAIPMANVLQPTCAVPTGTITVTSPTGAYYEYSKNGTIWQTSPVFNGLPGNATYTISVRNTATDPGCISSAQFVINQAPETPPAPLATLIQPTCVVPTGTITITSPVGPGYQYSKDGVTIQTSPVFSGLEANKTYTIYLRNTAYPDCIVSGRFTIGPIPNAPATPVATLVQPTCAVPTGTITVTSPTGAGYEYSRNGTTWQTSTQFSGLPGNATYTISVRNTNSAPGCVSSAQYVINSVPDAPVTPLATVIQPTCAVPTGKITVISPVGAMYEYSKNGTTWQMSPIFSGLPGNATYTISVRNTATDPACISTAPFVLNLVPEAPVTPLASVMQPTCSVPTGKITVTTPVGETYEYSKDGTIWQISPVFSDLPGNATYTISVRNVATDPGCLSSAQFVINQAPNVPPVPVATLIQPTCAVPTGTITITSPVGPGYQYSKDGVTVQTSPVFSGLEANKTYTIYLRNTAYPDCIVKGSFVIGPVPNLPATPLATLIQPTCAVPTGTITVTSPIGPTYEYSKNGVNWQSSPVFSGLPGNATYTISVRNTGTDQGCISGASFVILAVPGAPAIPLAVVIQPTYTVPTGTITITSPVGVNFEYSKNGTNWQTSPVFSGLPGNATYTIFVRNKATDPGCLSSAQFVITSTSVTGTQCFSSAAIPPDPRVGAKMTWIINPDNTITIRTTLAKTFVNNTYGTNAIGWPSGHKFTELVGSDHLQLALYDANNLKKAEFKMDYISASTTVPSGYKSLGVAGGDGNMIVGNESDIIKVVTSLDENFNNFGYVLTTNSPSTNNDYAPNASYPKWIYDVWYEVTLNMSVFGTSGFGKALISGVHASPSKTGKNSEPVTPTPCPELTLLAVATNETCQAAHDGTVDLTVSDGVQPFTYVWSNGATTQDLNNLAPGTYTVTVTDAAGTTATVSAVIQASVYPCSVITILVTATNETCTSANDGTIDLTITNGVAPYSYVWSNGATTQDLSNLSPGNYSVTVTDAAGATASANVIILGSTVPCQGLTTHIVVKHVSCILAHDGTINLSVEGGVAPYTYLWSNGATTQDLLNLASGTYHVTVTDAAGATTTASAVVEGSTVPCTGLTLIVTSTNESCSTAGNGSIDLTVLNGIQPITYQWSNGATVEDLSNLAPGSYSVIVTDATGATATACAVILGSGIPCSGTQCFSSASTPPNPNVHAELSWIFNPDNTITIRTTLAKTWVDNTYGTNAIGWPSGHQFTDLTGSDELQLSLYDANFVKKLEFKMDYLSESTAAPSGYKSLGVTAGDGAMIVGDAANIVRVVTSMDKNLNTYGYNLTTNSPATDNNYTPNALYPNWIYDVWYEVTVKASAFGTPGIGKALISGVHASPGKTGNNNEPVMKTSCAVLSAMLAIANVTCQSAEDGSIDLTVMNGVPPFTYLWSNGATTQDLQNLAPGTYNVIITDATGATATAGGVIAGSTIPCTILTASVVTSDVTCNTANDGSIDLTVIDGTAPYTYVWSNGATTQDIMNLAPGNYTVTVTDAKGATTTATGVVQSSAVLCPGTQCFSSAAVPPNPKVGATMTWVYNADNTITIRTTLAKTFVDNTYGTSVIGWPGDHKFGDLVGSDFLQLALYDANNVKKIEFKMDYLTASSGAPSGYKSLGVTGGDGNMISGNVADVVSVVTSLDKNLNTYGYLLTTNSPVTDNNYTPNPAYPNWIFDVWYEVTLKMTAFGAAGFGQALIPGLHASPSKTGKNTEPIGPCVTFAGESQLNKSAVADIGSLQTGEKPVSEMPEIDLKVYPNPSRGPVTFEFSVSIDADVAIDIYSLSGQRIGRIFDADVEAGVTHTAIFDKSLATGTYLYMVRWNNEIVTGKIILTR